MGNYHEAFVTSGKGDIYAVYGNDGNISITTKANYEAYIQNARLVHHVDWTFAEAVDYVHKYF